VDVDVDVDVKCERRNRRRLELIEYLNCCEVAEDWKSYTVVSILLVVTPMTV
jgi:hypothetical protein